MAFSIESRVPFLTPALATFLMSLPEDFLIAPDGTSKAVFRAAMRGIVPGEILDRRDKIGFATAEGTWLTSLEGWVDRTLAAGAEAGISCIDWVVATRRWKDAVARRRKVDAGVWRWCNLVEWASAVGVQFW